jgi:hypothetical protein
MGEDLSADMDAMMDQTEGSGETSSGIDSQ